MQLYTYTQLDNDEEEKSHIDHIIKFLREHHTGKILVFNFKNTKFAHFILSIYDSLTYTAVCVINTSKFDLYLEREYSHTTMKINGLKLKFTENKSTLPTISFIKKLESLYITNCCINNATFGDFSLLKVPHLREVNISGNIISEYVELCNFLGNSNINTLTFTRNELDCNNISLFVNYLRHEKSLVNIDISDNVVSYYDFKSIMDVLVRKKTIENLSLCGCFINTEYNFKYLIMMLKLFNKNNKLRSLNISNNSLRESDWDVLFRVPPTNTTLTNIDLSKSLYGRMCSLYIVDYSMLNKNLRTLNLSHNQLDDDTFIDILNVLKRNILLRKVDLSNNWITIQGFEKYIEILKDTIFVPVINMCSNELPLFGGNSIKIYETIKSLTKVNNSIRMKIHKIMIYILKCHGKEIKVINENFELFGFLSKVQKTILNAIFTQLHYLDYSIEKNNIFN